MSRAKFWLIVFIIVILLTLAGPEIAGLFGDPGRSSAMAYARDGALGLGFDYLGRPIAPQLLSGGRALLLAAALSAVLSQLVGLGIGLWLALNHKGSGLAGFVLDALLVLPITAISLVSYLIAGSSIYATIPMAIVLSTPFNSRYYCANAKPLLNAPFYEQALVAGDCQLAALFREVLPVLVKPIVTDFGLSTITAIYLLVTVSFLGSSSSEHGFLWPAMVSHNLQGLGLNPWASLAPVIAIGALTIPLNLFIDAWGQRHV